MTDHIVSIAHAIRLLTNANEHVIGNVGTELVEMWKDRFRQYQYDRLLKRLNPVGNVEPTKHHFSNLIGICKLFMVTETYESFVGDLEERYNVILKKQGPRSAQLWFWRQ